MSKSFNLHLIPLEPTERPDILTGFPDVSSVADYIRDNISGDRFRIMIFQSDLPPTRPRQPDLTPGK